MINRLIRIGLLIAVLASSVSCVKDGMEECPEGTVRIKIYAEKFRNKSQNPLDDREAVFADRVSHLRYYLYYNNTLKDQGIVDKFNKATRDSYIFDYSGLEYGDYKLVLVCNSALKALSGDMINADNLVLTYPGADTTEDYFSAVFPFTVNSNDVQEYEVGLLRAQGVIRYKFQNMPEDVSDIQIVMQNVWNEKWITGDYKNICEANKRYLMKPVKKDDETEEYIIATFPTPTGERSAYYLSLFRNGEPEPYHRQLITDTLTITRNQLIEITAIFTNGNFDFIVDLDSKWDGSNPGGTIGIE